MSATLQLDLAVVLPAAHGTHDRCVHDLITALERVDGIDSAHVVRADDASGSGNAQICVHLSPGAVSVKRLTARVRAMGASIEDSYGHLIVEVGGVGNTSRAGALTKRLRTLPGVVDGAVTVEGIVRVEFDHAETDAGAVYDQLGSSLGLRVHTPGPPPVGSVDDHGHEHEHDHGHGHGHGHGASRVELGAAFVSLAIYLVARFMDWFTDVDGPVTALYLVAAVVTGIFVARDAWLSVRAKVFDIDQLMLVAAVGAAVIGHWSDAALLLVLFSLGHALEGYAMTRARDAIGALAELAPATARRRAEPAVDVAVADLVVGDVLIVRPNERMPADGVVVAGESAVDESAVTGESVPSDKTPMPDPASALDGNGGIDGVEAPHRVFAGTLNGPSAIDVMVLRVAADSTLARVVAMVAEAETQISPTQRFTKRLVRVFVPSVLVLVGFLLLIPPLAGEDFTDSFVRAMAVLVAASPCALAIATPSAVLAAIARAARGGILVKGGGPLEELGRVSAIAFDKTGTLTAGKPRLTDVEPVAGVGDAELLRVVYSVEQSSDHPIARAITAGANERLADDQRPDATQVSAVSGRGVTGVLDGLPVLVGNAALFDRAEIPLDIIESRDLLEGRGRTTMIVRHGERYLGVLGVMDTPRPEAGTAIEQLRARGVTRVVMLSGDNQRVASAVASEVGIAEAQGGLLPADKVDAINRLAEGGGVAMVGDGVNDAPALAAANVGIAMGAAGSDVALETADIALMADRLEQLPVAVGLARQASRTIRQNLIFSLGVVALLIPMTILGVGISVAVIAHEGSTLVVVVNALRLLGPTRGN